MSTAARIDELRKKFEENPRRYFAPLANEYRKAGDLVQAIALCREHLPKQPGHMSGYIVFGQALYEAGELGEARLVFEQALALDPENLIALRHLGDIAQANGDAPGARRWYERVLDADPRNNDIAAQLASLATGMTPVSSPAVASSVSPFARPMDTPPLPMSPIGLGMTPTPDSVMRAVDMDAINARVIHRTPIDLDAMDASRHAGDSSPGSQSAESATANVDDTDPFGFPVSLRAATSPHATADASVADDTMYTVDLGDTDDVDAADDFAATVDSAANVELDADADADAAFEEGLIAPEWTDSADLVAQMSTPRSFTPRSETPIISDALPDTAAAFGRESHDVPDPVALDATLDDDASLIPLRAPTPAIPMVSLPTPAMGMMSMDQEPLDIAAMDLASMDLSSFTKAPVEVTPEAAVASADEAADEASDEVYVEATVETVTETEALSEADEFDVAYVAEVMDTADAATTDVPSLEGLDDFASPRNVDEQFIEMAVPEELPWLAVADATPADSMSVAETEREPGLQEIAEAIAEDARAAGDEHAITVSAVDEPTWSEHAVSDAGAFNEESFADDDDVVEVVAEPSDEFAADEPLALEALVSGDTGSDVADAEVATARATPSTGSTAFVTETMAELLISQGFHARAADVYEELVRRHPFDVVLTSRLAEVRAMLTPVPEAAASSANDETHEGLSDALFASESDSTDINSMPTPAYGTPAFGTPIYTAAITSQPTPDFNSAISAHVSMADDAAWVAPVRTTPYAQPAVVDEPPVPSRTAREWFAAIAARRVPRRTPPQSSPSVAESPTEGLASLFGTDASAQDDAAARALADAFAPVTSEDLAAGVALDFEFARSTPAYSPVVAASHTPMSTPSLPATVNPVQASASDDRSGSGGNAGFSFDKFFPDPATRRSTPAAGSGDTPSAPVTDDLAQFSAWLKGLGNT